MQPTLAWKIDLPFESLLTQALHIGLRATAQGIGVVLPSFMHPSYKRR
jgi:hypothetical protein